MVARKAPNNGVYSPTISPTPVIINDEEVPGGSVSPFLDIANHWSEKYVTALYQSKIVVGYEDGYFRPSDYINRAEAVALIAKSLGFPPSGSDQGTPFADDAQLPLWVMPYIRKMHSIGYIKGYEDYSFRPYNQISRGEFFLMVLNSFQFSQSLVSLSLSKEVYFADDLDIPDWVKPSATKAYQ